jgi:hypothetical protein
MLLMDLFDQLLQFQFVVFFAEKETDLVALQEKAVQLPTVLGNAGVRKEIGMSLKSPAVATAPAAGSAPLVQWAAGVWRVVWTPQRIDLVFDALGYSELKGPISIEAVAQSLAGDLGRVPEHLGQHASRAALVVTGQRTAADPVATLKVAERLGSDEFLTAARGTGLPDLLVRANKLARWQLGPSLIDVNRIETSNAVSGPQVASPTHNLLTWQADFNTDSLHTEDLGADALTTFFTKAAAEIGQAAKDLGRSYA